MHPVSGELVGIYIATGRGLPMQSVGDSQAVAGVGLAGDRYYHGEGTFSKRFQIAPGARALSLIDTRCVALCEERLQRPISPTMLRRNLLVDGLDLMSLRGWTLELGSVRIELVGSCPPCGYLTRLLALDMRTGLRGIGGMRARILSTGLLTTGQSIAAVKSR